MRKHFISIFLFRTPHKLHIYYYFFFPPVHFLNNYNSTLLIFFSPPFLQTTQTTYILFFFCSAHFLNNYNSTVLIFFLPRFLWMSFFVRTPSILSFLPYSLIFLLHPLENSGAFLTNQRQGHRNLSTMGCVHGCVHKKRCQNFV